MFHLSKKTVRINSVEAFACTCYCQTVTCSCSSCSHCYCEDFSPNSYAGLTENFSAEYSRNYNAYAQEGAATNSYRSALS